MFLRRRLSTNRLDQFSLSPRTSLSFLKIYSLLPHAFRLSNGKIHAGPLVLLGPNSLAWKRDSDDGSLAAIRTLLQLIRPLPDMIVFGVRDRSLQVSEIQKEFGCICEVSDPRIAAKTFDALIDDGRLAIGFFEEEAANDSTSADTKNSKSSDQSPEKPGKTPT